MGKILELPVSELKGVGQSVAKKLKKLGIVTADDLINHYPRRYDDFSQISKISQLKPGQVTIQGKILRAGTRRTSRRGFTITEAIIDDGSGAIKAVWFNQPYLAKVLPKDVSVYASGWLEFKFNQYALQNPVIERVSSFTKNTARIVPVYPETERLTSRQLRGLIEQVMPLIREYPEILPKPIIKNQQLMGKAEAVQQIHFPDSNHKLDQARHRLAFEELFSLILAGLTIKAEIQTEHSPKITFEEVVAKKFTANLPFKLTDAQRKAAWQILQDLDSLRPMQRLLEGDVGSGKTVVAALAAVMTIKAGYQTALMAPTEILATQHHRTLEPLLKKFGVRQNLLTGSTLKAEKNATIAKIISGQQDMIIGTHALLEPDVRFKNLGFVIIDEQHRFGVNQRNQLKSKAGYLPHLLTMSATPIPRSLALTIYGDLDISIIDQLPPDRKPVLTRVVPDKERDKVYSQIDQQIQAGRQVYVVCPLISESDKLGVKSVEAEAARLKQTVFKHRRLGVLHGRMKPAEKDSIMSKFKQGKIDLLVSTTVVEVGVDVPNASVMLIEGAERFGLATLHQLRGRVGRGAEQSYAYLLATNDFQSRQRLELLEKYNDGFVLAQKDMELRGPGAIYGTRQHGLLDLRLADLSDTKFIAHVRQAAKDFLEKDSMKKYPLLLDKVNRLRSVTTLD